MIPKELAEQAQVEIQRLKETHDTFLQTYKQLCLHCGGPTWRKSDTELVFHRVREEIIPMLERVGVDHKDVQALCAWAERHVMTH